MILALADSILPLPCASKLSTLIPFSNLDSSCRSTPSFLAAEIETTRTEANKLYSETKLCNDRVTAQRNSGSFPTIRSEMKDSRKLLVFSLSRSLSLSLCFSVYSTSVAAYSWVVPAPKREKLPGTMFSPRAAHKHIFIWRGKVDVSLPLGAGAIQEGVMPFVQGS